MRLRAALLAALLVACADTGTAPEPMPGSLADVPGDPATLDRDIYACGYGGPKEGLPISEESLRDAAIADARSNLIQRLAALDLGSRSFGSALDTAGRMERLAALVAQAKLLDLQAEGEIRQARIRIGLADVRALLATPELVLSALGAAYDPAHYAPPGTTQWPWADGPFDGMNTAPMEPALQAMPGPTRILARGATSAPLGSRKEDGHGPRLYLATPWRPAPRGEELVVAGTLFDPSGVASLTAGRTPERMIAAGGKAGVVRPFRLVLPLGGAERLYLTAKDGEGNTASWVIEIRR